MRGIVLAGGTGSRLTPMTEYINKHLLQVYDRPMLLYPIETLVSAGIEEMMIITGPDHVHQFRTLLGEHGERLGERLGIDLRGTRIEYGLQSGPGGIAQALGLTRSFGAGHDIAVILGDNIYEKTPDVSGFVGGARLPEARGGSQAVRRRDPG